MKGLTIFVASFLASSLALVLAMPGESWPLATKSGVKFKDLDGDGYRDPGEPGLSGWKIHLFGTGEGGSRDLTTTTDSLGRYSFSVPRGTYTVCEEQKAGWVQSFPNPGSDGTRCDTHGHTGWTSSAPNGYYFTLSAGQIHSGNDFGNKPPARKEGKKFKDLDGDGVKDAGEPGLGGWVIRAYRDNNPANDLLDAAEFSAGAVASATTSYSTGAYSLSLAPGDYIVCEVQQSGWVQTFPSGAPAECGAGAGLGAQGYAVTLSAGQVDSYNDFGNVQNARKEGKKFKDLNRNGYKDWWEPGLGGWVIRAYADNNPANGDLDLAEFNAGPVASATTSTSGFYSLSLAPGRYIVCEVQQNGWAQTAPSGGTAECDADPSLAPQGYAITLTSGQCDTGNNFGNVQVQQAFKSGRKFADLDGDHTDDLGADPGLPNWTINLYRDNAPLGVLDGGDTLATSTTTGADGGYSFTLTAGVNYIVCEVLQPGWTQSAPNPGTANCSFNPSLGAQGYRVNLAAGAEEKRNDFGNFQQADKSGSKFEDDNGDGVKDAGEDAPAVAFTIYLFRDDGDGVLEDSDDGTSDAAFTPLSSEATVAGAYSFEDLAPGEYIVCEEDKTDWFQTYPNATLVAAAQLADCSANSAVEDNGWEVTISSGVDDTGNDFGNFQKADKSGVKFEDDNANGVKDTGEDAPAVAFTIYLFRDDGDGELEDGDDGAADAAFTPLSSQATVAGAYAFQDLAPGDYIVCEEDKADWFQTYPGTAVPAAEVADCSANSAVEDNGWEVTIVSGVDDTGNDFGNFQKADKSGVKFEDDNGDGNKDVGEEAPAVAFTIYLFRDDGDGVLEDSDDGFPDAVFTPQSSQATVAGAYSFQDLLPGDYIVCEEDKAGWSQTYPNAVEVPAAQLADCSANPAVEDNGWEVTIVSGVDDTGNDFGNKQDVVCEKGPVQDVLHPDTGRFPGNKGPDVIVQTNLWPAPGGNVQTAVDTVTDVNSDGYLIVFVRKDATGDLGGNSPQDVAITNDYTNATTYGESKIFALIGCSVELRDPDDTDPGIHITSAAKGKPYTFDGDTSNIFLMDLHAADSSLGPGIKVEGDGRYLRNEEAHRNATGFQFVSNSNFMHNGSAENNTGVGILVQGNANSVEDADASSNNGANAHGVHVTGNQNQILKIDAVGNGGDGLRITGDNNNLEENTGEENDGNGIKADSADGASGNTLTKNQGNDDNDLQGIRACGQIDGGENEGEGNGVDPQVDFVCAPGPAVFFVADNADNKVYKYNGSGAVIGSVVLHADNDDPSGVSLAGGKLYVLDRADDSVYRYDATTGAYEATSRQLVQSTPTPVGGPLNMPSGLAIDGDHMWVVDDGNTEILRYSLAAAFPTPGTVNALPPEVDFTLSGHGSGEGLAIDSACLYVLDDADDAFYRYDRPEVAGSCGGNPATARPLKPTSGTTNLGPIRGATLVGTSLWIVDAGTDRAYEYAVGGPFAGSGNLNATSQFDLYVNNEDASGT